MKNSQSKWRLSPNEKFSVPMDILPKFQLDLFFRGWEDFVVLIYVLSISIKIINMLISWSVHQFTSNSGRGLNTHDGLSFGGRTLHVVTNAFCNWNVTLNFRSPSTLCLYIASLCCDVVGFDISIKKRKWQKLLNNWILCILYPTSWSTRFHAWNLVIGATVNERQTCKLCRMQMDWIRPCYDCC